MKTITELLAEAKALSIQVDGEKYGMVKFTVGIAEMDHVDKFFYEYSIYTAKRGIVQGETLEQVFLNFKVKLGLFVEPEISI